MRVLEERNREREGWYTVGKELLVEKEHFPASSRGKDITFVLMIFSEVG